MDNCSNAFGRHYLSISKPTLCLVILLTNLSLGTMVYAQKEFASQFVRNLQVSSSLGPELGENLVVFVVSEFQEGSSDLNGDGDATDYVIHVYHVRSNTTTNLRLASTAFQVDGQVVAFLVNENGQGGTDLNDDGDASDNVAFVYDGESGKIENLGISTGLETFGPQVSGNLVAIAVEERAQGTTDLNADGDIEDLFILHIHDVSTGLTTNLGLATGFVSIISESNQVAFPVSEYDQGQTDLNGDTDFFDVVMHIYDATTGTMTNTGMATGYSLPKTQDNLVLFSVEEFSQDETDFNGDGDTSDQVAFLYNTKKDELINLGLAVAENRLDVSGDIAVISVKEEDQGATDLNGDGDLFDRVDHVYNLNKGSTTNLGLSSAGFVLRGQRLAFRVWESGEGFTDLNGDGDTNDVVLHLHDAGKNLTTNVGLATEFDVQFDGNLLAFRVSESFQAFSDLNGDGDVADTVVHTLDANSGVLSNLGLAVLANGIQVDAPRMALKVDESSQGSTDLNRDGDFGDKVLHAYNSNTGMKYNTGHAVDDFRISKTVISFDVPEASQGKTDLNNDKDTQDRVVHLARFF